ncbi:ACP S-malonyltransferase [Actinomadura sp. 9N407]|uniref:ACP S-malonyltransferase n=1 Tax=Actinomadura sp. 9N407 TaxID=3375154 RepID=UPI00379631A6
MALSFGWTPELKPDDVCALLFPGTGSAGPPDLRTLAARDPAAACAVDDVLDAVQEGLPRPPDWPSMRAVLLEDPNRYRAASRVPGVAQLAAYTASVAVDRSLRACGLTPGFAVGQSFGEIAALVCAGAFSVTDGARMARSLVEVLTRRGAGGGLGLLETGEDGARALIDRAGTGGQVVVACLNAPSVTVVSGPGGPLEQVLDTARGQGVRAVRLAVPYLSHHPAMAGADQEWYGLIRAFPQRPLRITVHSPVRGRAYTDDDDLHRALADCIVKPVRLPGTLRAVHAAGASVFVEAGAGDALCQCARLTVPAAATLVPLRDRPRRTAATAVHPGAADACAADATTPAAEPPAPAPAADPGS